MVFIGPMRITAAAAALLVWFLPAAPILAQKGDPKGFTPPGRAVPSLGNSHIQNAGDPHVPYNSVPPTSGPHLHFIAKWGVSKTPIPDELQVHNLEDGGVMIQYNCDPVKDGKACAELAARLEPFAKNFNRVIVAPYLKMKTPIALTAWGRIDTMDKFDEARIERFIKAYMGIDHHPRE